MDFTHFIITQFNLRTFPLSRGPEHDDWIKWTGSRIRLFREYCLPSLLNQTCRNFKWLIYFDSETPGEFNDFLEELRQLSGINICYSNGMDDFSENYMKEVRKRIGKQAGWIITTRIDNDDCLHKDAVKTIQENFTGRHKFLISLASGYVLNTGDMTLSHYYYPMSPFISLIEDAEIEIRGVFEKIHTKWDCLRLFIFREIWLEYINGKARRSRFILKKPLWIQTVHGGNISNSFYRGFPVIRRKDLSDFSLNRFSNRLPVKTTLKYYNYVVWKRYLKSLVVRFFINK